MPHYQNVPQGWCISKLGEIFQHNNGKQKTSSNQRGELRKYITTSNVYWGKFDFSEIKEMNFEESELEKCTTNKGDFLVCEGGDIGRAAIWDSETPICIQNHLHRLRAYIPVCTKYFLFSLMYAKSKGFINGKGIGLMSLSSNDLHNIPISLPPLSEQHRIVTELEKWFALIDEIEAGQKDLATLIEQAKSKILDLAIHGKLVPQDPTDEPAVELLKSINPQWQPCDTSHYENLPQGWCECRLEEVVDYEQPQVYIVENTNYSDDYETPVLTAGKSFIIGHTNETKGVFKNVPVIIFDDFTTDSKYIDFPFKVKSSAMKILHVREGINIQFIAMLMSITRLTGDTHKRYWISEYSKLPIMLPPKQEQDTIVTYVDELFKYLDSIGTTLTD